MITQLTKMIENTRIKYRLMKLTKINYILYFHNHKGKQKNIYTVNQRR